MDHLCFQKMSLIMQHLLNSWDLRERIGKAIYLSFLLPKHSTPLHAQKQGSCPEFNKATTYSPSQHLDTLIFCFDDMTRGDLETRFRFPAA